MGTRAGGCVCFKATTRICGISHIIPATLRTLTKARNVPFSKGQFKRCRNWVSDRPQKYLSRQQAPRKLQAAEAWNKRQNTPRQKSDNSYWRKAVNSNKARKARVKESVKYRPFSSLPFFSCQELRFRHKPEMYTAHSTSRQAQKLSRHIKSTTQ